MSELTKAMQTGNRLEAALVDFACEELGFSVRRNVYRVSQTHNVLAAHLDALIRDRPEAVEAKFVGQSNAADWGQPGTDEVPEHVIVQVQHQMFVADLERVWVAAAVAGWSLDWRLYCVERHEGLIKIIVEAELKFWHTHVVPEIPPTPGPPPMEVIRLLRREPESLIYLAESDAAALDEYDRLNDEKKRAEKEAEESKRRLLGLLGEHEAGMLPDMTLISYVQQRSPARCDLKRLRAGWPEAYAECVTQGSHRVLRIKKPKETITDGRDPETTPRIGADRVGPEGPATDQP